MNYVGKLEIPNPWMRFLHENKANWKERAAKGLTGTEDGEKRRDSEEEERKRQEAKENGETKENGTK